MNSYFLEFRLHGYAKKYAKRLIFDVAKKFNVRGVTRKKPVPHITLIAPFKTNYGKQVIKVMGGVCKNYDLVKFKLQGFNYFDNKINKVIYLDIAPSATLKKFRKDLAEGLNRIPDLKGKIYTKDDFQFHATVAFKDIDRKFKKIWEYISSKKEPDINQYLLRVSLLGRGGRIIYEYDLILKRYLNRKQALSKFWWSKTVERMKELSAGHDEECSRDSLPKPPKREINIFGLRFRF